MSASKDKVIAFPCRRPSGRGCARTAALALPLGEVAVQLLRALAAREKEVV